MEEKMIIYQVFTRLFGNKGLETNIGINPGKIRTFVRGIQEFK